MYVCRLTDYETQHPPIPALVKPTQELIALRYLEALKTIADGKATKLFLPYEASGILSSLAGIGEIMKDGAAHVSTGADGAT